MAHSSTTLSNVINTWFNKNFVSDLEHTLQHQKFTEKAIIPAGSGNPGRFFTLEQPQSTGYAAGSTAITEGSTTANEITSLTQGTTNVTVAEFGEFLKINDLAEYAQVSTMREKVRKRMRDGAAVSLDSFTESKARQSTTIWYATAAQAGGTTTAPASVTALGASSLIGSRKVLLGNLCKGFDGISGHPSGHFAAVLTPKQELDVVTEVTTLRVYWSNAVVNVPGAMGQEKFVNGYIGSIYQVATYVTNNFATTTYTSAVDIGYVFADGGVGAMAFGDMAPQVIINDVNSPYKNVNTIAWHARYGAALIASTRVVKLYSLS